MCWFLVGKKKHCIHHRVGRVLSYFPVVGIGTPPPLTRRRMCPPGSGGRGILAGERGVVLIFFKVQWMRSTLVDRASDCQYRSCNSRGFDPSIRRHSGIWRAADEAVLDKVHRKKSIKIPLLIFSSKEEKTYSRFLTKIFLDLWRIVHCICTCLAYYGASEAVNLCGR